MERWLNSRPALITAWSLVGLMCTAILGAALYVTIPLVFGDGDGGARAIATLVPAPSGTPAGTRSRVSGTIEKVEGSALTLKPSAGDPVRVVLRRSTVIGRLVSTTADDIAAGREAVIRYASRDGSGQLAFRVWLQPVAMVPPEDAGRPLSGGAPVNVAIGTIVSRVGNQLRIRSGDADLSLEIPTTVRVERFEPVPAGDLSAGLRVTVFGERLVDGSLAAGSVQVFGSR